MLKEQKNLLKLIKEIDAICRENNITYYAAGGTVIGAVRHKGFIPWDDDIDIYMTRDNWNRFRDCMKTQIPDRRILECWENNRGYQNLLGRYMDLDTTAIFKYQLYGDANMGQLIDVFVLDPVPNNTKALKGYEKDVMLASDIVGDCISYSERLTSCDEYEELRKEVEKRGRDVVVDEVVARLEQYTEEESDCYMLRWGGIPHIFPKEMFQEPVYLPFEDMEMAMPSKVSDYLCQLYGMDWMYIPGVEGQIVHSYIIADNNMPYSRMKSLVYPRVDTSATDRFVENKKHVFANLQLLHDADEDRLTLEGSYVKARLIEGIERENIDIKKEFENKEYDKLFGIFSEFIAMQTNKIFIGNGTFEGYYKKWNPTYINIGDELLYYVLQVMLEKNMPSKVDKILRVREMNGQLDENLSKIRELLNVILEASNLYEVGKFSEAENLVDEYYEKTENIQLLKFKLFLIEARMGKDPSEEDVNEIEKWTNQGKARDPRDGDYNKFAGDVLWYRGNHVASVEEYTTSIVNTRNGVIRRLISERLADNIQAIDDYISKTTDPELFREQINAWVEVYPQNTQLLVKKLIDLGDDFDDIWRDGNLRERLCDNDNEELIKAVAQIMNWSEANVETEILLRQSEIKSVEPIEFDVDKLKSAVNSEGTKEIDKWQQAELLKLEGERKNAYQKYIELCKSEDSYVRKMIFKRFKGDFRGFVRRARKGKETWIKADVNVKYGSLNAEEYINLMKELDIIGDDYSFNSEITGIAQLICADYNKLSEYLEGGNVIPQEDGDNDED